MKRKTMEEYIEVIYILEKKHGRAGTNKTACLLDVNPASVTEMFGKLEADGYIDYVPYHGATLTVKGNRIASKLMKKHRLIADFFMAIGVEEMVAEVDACKIEHIISDGTITVLREFVDYLASDQGERFIRDFRTSKDEESCGTK